MVEAGEAGAQVAIELHDNPTKFLAVVQVGITSIAILNGIVGDAAFSEPLAGWLHRAIDLSERAAHITATALVVLIITVLTIIFGELVPKRLGQTHPETVARLVAPTMNWLAMVTRPFVRLLSVCTDATLRLMGVRPGASRSVTEEEIAASLEEGLDAGVIEAQEHQMVRNVFRLDERQVGSMMIPRTDIAWLDVAASSEDVLTLLAETGEKPNALLMSRERYTSHESVSQGALSLDGSEGASVPETLSGMELLEHFRASASQLVFVVDEYGEVQGVISVRDVLEAITGEFATATSEGAWAVQRADGSWLLDGLIPVPELKDRLELKELPEEDRGRYNTLAGMIMLLLGRLPHTTDTVEWNGWRFEVVDLDGKRVDKVLVSKLDESEGDTSP